MSGFGAVFACLGAMIGAGFASGREIIVFFSCYGLHSWWLIAVAAGIMTWICRLYMRLASKNTDWTTVFGRRGQWMVAVSCSLMIITGGAMTSAAGHLCELLMKNNFASIGGAVWTLLAAWLISRKNLKMMEWLSAVLSILLVCVLISCFALPQKRVVQIANNFSIGRLVRAGVYAAAYAAMNAMLASGVICRCKSGGWFAAAGTGSMLAVLLGLSNALYLRHPELLNDTLPIVALLNTSGRTGFLLCAVLMYLSVFTTLAAIMCALRDAAERYLKSPLCGALCTLGLPLAVSCVGFSEIVNAMYAPAGLVCLLTIFLPLQWKHRVQTNA